MGTTVGQPRLEDIAGRSELGTLRALVSIVVRRTFRRWKWWILFLPLAQILLAGVIIVAFATLVRGTTALGTGMTYAISVYAGLAVWTIVSDSVLQSGRLFEENRAYVMRFRLPLWSYALGPLVLRLAVLGAAIPVLVATSWLAFHGLGWRLAVLPLMLCGLAMLALGLSWLSATAGALDHRLGPFLPHLLMLWFFATPIVYPRSILPKGLQLLSAINPMTHVVECFQWIWLPHRAVDTSSWIGTLLATGMFFGLGLFAVQRSENGIRDRL